jgi:hypothetical protein
MSERNDFHLFIQENGTWILSFCGILGACMSGLTIYFLKSRCSHIRLCYGCIDCIREPIPVSVLDIEEARPVN